jgi:phosphate transport system substrate-binding protein
MIRRRGVFSNACPSIVYDITGAAMLRWMLVFLSGGLLCFSVLAQTPADDLASDPDLSQFAAWLAKTNLMPDTNSEITLFAPTNDAINDLPSSVRALLARNTGLLTRVVSYHLVAESLTEANLESGLLTTEEGDSLMVLRTDAALTVDGVLISGADVTVGTLVIHKIEGVLIPPIVLPDTDPLEINGDIISAGSSTVHPLTEHMAEVFSEQGYSDTILVDNIGTGAGFERFCIAADADIANASRAIKPEELTACLASGRDPLEFRVGTDALAIVVSSENDFVDDLTLEELAQVFGGAKTWQEIRPEWPDDPIHLYSPGTDSGTFDYFVEEVFANDPDRILAAQPTMSEDDEILVSGAENDPYAIAYFGYAYYLKHIDRLKLVAIEGILPSEVTAENGTYSLSRPLYIYSAASVFAEKPEVAAFVQFYLNNVSAEILEVGYFPASERALNLGRLTWLAGQLS